MTPDPPRAIEDEALETLQARDRIAEAAERLFAEKGFDATSVREITAEAGCNVAAVSYHFGGKDELYRAVVRRRLRLTSEIEEARSARRRGRPAGGSAEAALRSHARELAAPFLQPEAGGRLLTLWMREQVDRRLAAGEMQEGIPGPSPETLAAELCRTVPGLTPTAAETAAVAFGATLMGLIQLRPGAAVPRPVGPAAEGRSVGALTPRMLEAVVTLTADALKAAGARRQSATRARRARTRRRAPRKKGRATVR